MLCCSIATKRRRYAVFFTAILICTLVYGSLIFSLPATSGLDSNVQVVAKRLEKLQDGGKQSPSGQREILNIKGKSF